MAADKEPLLLSLTEAANAVQATGAPFDTVVFTQLCDRILRVFDYLGPLLHFAKNDMVVKNHSLKDVADKLPRLDEVVAADKKAGKYTVKNSCARNLHRLVHVVLFLATIFEKLHSSPSVTLKDAVYGAYTSSLAPLHTYVVQTAVWAGLMILPSRESFLQQIGETEATAEAKAMAFVTSARAVVSELLKLFDEPMPASTDTRVS